MFFPLSWIWCRSSVALNLLLWKHGTKSWNFWNFKLTQWEVWRCLFKFPLSWPCIYVRLISPKKRHWHSTVLCYCSEGNNKRGESQGGTSESSPLCTIRSSCMDRCLDAWMRHYIASTERPHNIIHELNNSAGNPPSDRSFLEIESPRWSITSHDYWLISLAKWQECTHSHQDLPIFEYCWN